MFKSFGPNMFAWSGAWVLVAFAALLIGGSPVSEYLQTVTRGTGALGFCFLILALGLATSLSVGLFGPAISKVIKPTEKQPEQVESAKHAM